MPTFNVSTTLLFLFVISLLSLTSETAPDYVRHVCTNTSTYTPNSTYQANLDSVLSSLYSNTISLLCQVDPDPDRGKRCKTRHNWFYNFSAGRNRPDIAYGLFLCRGDVTADVCQDCVKTATTELPQRCPNEIEAIIWYDMCMLRYSNRSFFSVVEDSPNVFLHNTTNITEQGRFNQLVTNRFNQLVTNTINDIAIRAANELSDKKFATEEANFTRLQKLYSLVQCTPDLTVSDCYQCLQTAIAYLPVIAGKQGGRALLPNCNMRFEVYPFYTSIAAAPAPTPRLVPRPASSTTEGGKDPRLAIGTSVSAFVLVALLGTCIFYVRRRKQANKEENKNNQEIQVLELVGGRLANDYSNENLHEEKEMKSQEFPLIRLELINAATNYFSNEKKLGEGGFGPVYKGTLVDGKEIAVKRLSKTSGQGLTEFKTEVTLIARLQHRNLVRLLGCCLEGDESLLIYEYMPNKSLDVFLFDSTKGAQLDWKKRLGIINGVARGLLYLHEDSRLKIIHRDLKTSNILLDHEMNPKISDFGMARIFYGNQSEGNTKRVVGTYGYMAPEYAMEGLFSVKSDVFSFGVLLLEVISGKKNNGFYLSELGQSLLTFAWELWSKGRGLELIDPLLVQSCVAVEVLKYIHIGLLCVQEDPADRPTMSSVVVMLGSDTITLAQPTQPAFSVGRLAMRPAECIANDKVCSINEVTLSRVSPR